MIWNIILPTIRVMAPSVLVQSAANGVLGTAQRHCALSPQVTVDSARQTLSDPLFARDLCRLQTLSTLVAGIIPDARSMTDTVVIALTVKTVSSNVKIAQMMENNSVTLRPSTIQNQISGGEAPAHWWLRVRH